MQRLPALLDVFCVCYLYARLLEHPVSDLSIEGIVLTEQDMKPCQAGPYVVRQRFFDGFGRNAGRQFEIDGEGAATAGSAFYTDAAVHEIYQAFHDRQAKTGSGSFFDME